MTDLPSFVPEAVRYLLETLARHGNTVGDDHRAAVSAIPELAEAILRGQLSTYAVKEPYTGHVDKLTLKGRFRVGLPCGMGKTTALRATLRAIHVLDLPYRTCSKVEELCTLKRTLMAVEGIPESKLGLQHSYVLDPKRAAQGHDGYASLPSEGHDRQFLLVTHANVQSEKLRPWMVDRDLVLFDESLVVGSAHTLNLMDMTRSCVVAEWASLRALAEGFPELAPCAAWFDVVVGRLRKAVEGHTNDEVRTLKLEAPDTQLTASFRRLRLFACEQCPTLATLMELVERAEELRLYTQDSGRQSLITYRTSVPPELQNVIVLDASDPIRELVHHDARMRRVEDVLPSLARFRDVPGGISSVKHHARVQVYFAGDAGSRKVMAPEFRKAEAGEQTKAIGKLIRLIQSKPTESFLIYTYKDRDGTKFATTIIKALERAGIAYPDFQPGGHGRINVETWGRETATNEYAHCQNIVLLGVIFQPEESIAGCVHRSMTDAIPG